MMPVHLLLVVVLQLQDSPGPRIDCKEWHECQQLALNAAERQDYEAFHDLAWRAVQTGPKNDPTLMYLLARAQSLSGRPSDALVMLQRLAQMGGKTDAATNDDFVGCVRCRDGRNPKAAIRREPRRHQQQHRLRRHPLPSPPPERNESRGAATEPSPTVAPAPKASARATPPALSANLRFTLSLAPAGLAYDAVSRRFIVADREARRLTVVDEFSQHVANLASAQSAGFGSIAALEIDRGLGTSGSSAAARRSRVRRIPTTIADDAAQAPVDFRTSAPELRVADDWPRRRSLTSLPRSTARFWRSTPPVTAYSGWGRGRRNWKWL